MTRRRLELAEAPALAPFFRAQRYPLAVYSLLSVMAWRRADGFEVSYEILDDLLVLTAEGAGGRHLALPIGARTPTVPELRAVSERTGCAEYWYAPAEYLASLPEDELRAAFAVAERPEWGEYTFLAEDLAELKGRRLAAKRNLIHQFEKVYVSEGRAAAGPISRADVDECAEFLEAWCVERGCEDAGLQPLECERRAARTALGEMHELGAEGVAVRVDGRVVGFGIGYRVTKEGDMGLPGLEQSKRSYGPLFKTAAFSLSLR